jgi:membrane-associated phospholipid phosphatase
VHTLFHLIQGVDLQIYYLLSRLHGNWFFDRVVSEVESNVLSKSGPLIALYWYFWFIDDPKKRERRTTILAILGGTLAGLVVARMVAIVAPFRIRPMYDLSLVAHILSTPKSSSLMDWSSFPSDHAAYLGALAFGVSRLSRRLTLPVALFWTIWIALPRMYLGIHYASDLVAGAVFGIVPVWLSIRAVGDRFYVARPLLMFAEAKPHIFYPAAFLVMFEMASLFSDIRQPASAMLHATSGWAHRGTFSVGLALSAALCMSAIATRGRIARVRLWFVRPLSAGENSART